MTLAALMAAMTAIVGANRIRFLLRLSASGFQLAAVSVRPAERKAADLSRPQVASEWAAPRSCPAPHLPPAERERVSGSYVLPESPLQLVELGAARAQHLVGQLGQRRGDGVA